VLKACDDAADLQVPGSKFTFGMVKVAQARGDLDVQVERGRRTLRVHLGAVVKLGLKRIHQVPAEAGAAGTFSLNI